MKTKKFRETHDRIVEAATELFKSKSVNQVTIMEIVKKAGVSKGTFYLHFESKDTLVWHIIDHNLAPMFDWLNGFDETGYAKEDIELAADYLVKLVKEHKDILNMIHHVRFYNFLGLENMERKLTSEYVEPIYKWLLKGKQTLQLNIDDPRFLSLFLASAIHDVIDYIVSDQIDIPYDLLAYELKSLLIKLLK